MKTLKNIALGIGLALWAWWGLTGWAMAQVGPYSAQSMSCDSNMGTPCNPALTNLIDPPAYTNLICASDFECAYPPSVGFGHDSITNFQECGVFGEPPWTQTCASTHCMVWGGNNHEYCCAAPGQAVVALYDTLLTCEAPVAGYDVDPYNLGCTYGAHSYDFSGLVCGNATGALAGPDPFETFVDAGTNPLGGIYRLMKTSEWLIDAGITIVEPLGFYWQGNAGYSATEYTPNYVCQMPQYKFDGGWLEMDVGATHVDLMECGGFPTDVLGSGYFPCCGEEHDAGGYPYLCQHDSFHSPQTNHCACVQDGYECDRPRLLDKDHYDGFDGPEGAGECCSPYASTQLHVTNQVDGTPVGTYDDAGNLVLAQNQGWCRPPGGVNPYTANPDSGSTTVAGYCNCLPLHVPCASSTDCCNSGVGTSSCVADGGPATCCINKTFVGCTGDSDCCGAWNKSESLAEANRCVSGQCEACSALYGPCNSASDCCDPSQVCGGWEFSDGGGICTPPGDLGSGCQSDSWCSTGTYCSCNGYACNGTCLVCESIGGSCTANAQCCTSAGVQTCNQSNNECGCSSAYPILPDTCVTTADCCPGVGLTCVGGFCQ